MCKCCATVEDPVKLWARGSEDRYHWHAGLGPG